MASIHRLLHLALVSSIARCSMGDSNDTAVYIECAVCKKAMKEASFVAKVRDVVDKEDKLKDVLENLCAVNKDEGKWITKLDIIMKKRDGPSGVELALDRQTKEGVCNNECKSMQTACAKVLKRNEGKLVKMIGDSAGIGKLQKELCKKPCNKALPVLGKWEDEAFQIKPPPAPTPPKHHKYKQETVDSLLEMGRGILPPLFGEFAAGLPEAKFKHTAKLQAAIPACFNTASSVDASFDFMKALNRYVDDELMKKELPKIRNGLVGISKAIVKLAETVEKVCRDHPKPPRALKAAAEKLKYYCDKGKVKYEIHKSLKVGGRDLHMPVNDFLEGYTQEEADGGKIGTHLGKILAMFREEDETKDKKSKPAKGKSEL